MFEELMAHVIIEERRQRAESTWLIAKSKAPRPRSEDDRLSAWERIKEFLEGASSASVVVPAAVRTEAESWRMRA